LFGCTSWLPQWGGSRCSWAAYSLKCHISNWSQWH
jgi:hypothetical protein